MSSSVISRFKSLIKGFKPLPIALITPTQVSSSSISLYILFSIKILSKEEKCHCSSNSFNWICSSFFSKLTVKSVECFSISETPINTGLLSSIVQHKGEIEFSQFVKA
ncbi:MAG: Uncharacterised protein [Polaribacter sp. SA4-10]|nr:MAG: Uncharacterised protein [Polaribacter sp. SA4-10]